MNDDAQLINRSLQGQTDAFGLLVEKYQNRLFNTMTQVVGCPNEAEDIVQDAFVQAFVKLDSFRGDSAFYTWLYRIAFNQSISRRRRKRPRVSLDHVHEAAGEEPHDDAEPPAEYLLRQERAEQLGRALADLSEEHRVILALRETNGSGYEEIADILDVPLGTVRSRLHRARLALRDRLEEMVAENPLD